MQRTADPRLAPLLALRRLMPLADDAEAKRERRLAHRIELSERVRK